MSEKLTIEEVTEVGEIVGINWDEVDFTPEVLLQGMTVELEHGKKDPETDVTGDDLETTAKIAWAHLKEFPDYYDRLKKVEKAAKHIGRVIRCLAWFNDDMHVPQDKSEDPQGLAEAKVEKKKTKKRKSLV